MKCWWQQWRSSIGWFALYVAAGILLTLSGAPTSMFVLASAGAFVWLKDLELGCAFAWALVLWLAWESSLTFMWVWAWGWMWVWSGIDREWRGMMPRRWVAIVVVALAGLGLLVGAFLGSRVVDVSFPAEWGFLPVWLR
ncbi:MAG: hypothetical protein ACFB9N_07320 [Geitlerinemataceae cyanobacterium]